MEDILYTVPETAKLIKTNQAYVYSLIKSGVLPALKLGSLKIRRTTLEQFLEQYENFDLTDPTDVQELKH